jgi:hypothetical protein
MRARQYLDIYRAYEITAPESEVGAGKTLRCRLSESRGGDPATVALVASTAELTATASAGAYTIVITPAAMASLAAAHLMRTIYAHLHDGTGWRDVLPLVPTDTDPDVLPALQG